MRERLRGDDSKLFIYFADPLAICPENIPRSPWTRMTSRRRNAQFGVLVWASWGFRARICVIKKRRRRRMG